MVSENLVEILKSTSKDALLLLLDEKELSYDAVSSRNNGRFAYRVQLSQRGKEPRTLLFGQHIYNVYKDARDEGIRIVGELRELNKDGRLREKLKEKP